MSASVVVIVVTETLNILSQPAYCQNLWIHRLLLPIAHALLWVATLSWAGYAHVCGFALELLSFIRYAIAYCRDNLECRLAEIYGWTHTGTTTKHTCKAGISVTITIVPKLLMLTILDYTNNITDIINYSYCVYTVLCSNLFHWSAYHGA